MPGQQDDLFDYDAELRRYHQHLRAAIAVRPADRVLDIGCGTGQTTREAARAAASGSVLGIDISAARLAPARRLARAEGLRNISFVQADAQTHRFPPGPAAPRPRPRPRGGRAVKHRHVRGIEVQVGGPVNIGEARARARSRLDRLADSRVPGPRNVHLSW